MHQKVKITALWIYRILLSLSIICAGLCLMAQCLLLYRSGTPFSREAVAAAFSQIAVPVYLCGSLVLAGVLLKPFLPRAKDRVEKNLDLILSRLQNSVDLGLCPADMRQAVLQKRQLRRAVRIIGWILFSASSILFLVYGTNPAHFHQTEISSSMLGAMRRLAHCMAEPFAYSIFAAYYSKHSIQKEIALLKTAPAEAKCTPAPKPVRSASLPWLRYAILAIALALIFGGYALGGAVDVLTKAVNICTECIGLG